MKNLPPMLAHLSSRCLISITGEDRLSFLQGLITADIFQLESKQSLWSAVLTPQGRLVADFFILTPQKDVIFLECAHSQRDLLLNFFKKFCLRSQVSLKAHDGMVFALWNNPSPNTIPADGYSYPDPRHNQIGMRLITSEDTSLKANTSLDAYEEHRLSLGIPDPSIDGHSQETLPAECDMDLLGGISWDKGCYIGQEITARLHYRKKLKKRLIPLSSATDLPPLGTPILSGEKIVGDMRSSYEKRGLAMLKADSLSEDLRTADGQKLTLTLPPWLKEGLDAEEGEEK